MNLKGDLSIVRSRNIYDYKPILEELTDDFETDHYKDILEWCGVLSSTDNSRHWNVHLIKDKEQVIGLCGLYGLYPYSTEELWLGWFGIIPSKRNQGVGQYALDWMKRYADFLGCKKLMSYVGEDGSPLEFYYRNGFRMVGTVKEYLLMHPELTLDYFGDENYFIIECDL